MRRLQVIDMTLRRVGKDAGKEMSFKEKLEIARSIDRLRADAIELAPISGSKAESLANRTIASMVSARISAAVDFSNPLIEETWESIRTAKSPALNLLVPVSTVLMEYEAHKKAPVLLEDVSALVSHARFCSEHVEFTAVDATRAEPEFLCKALNTALDTGADRVTLCDTAGVMLPDEFAAFIAQVKAQVPRLAETEFFVELSDGIGMALACAAAAVREGASGVKCAALGEDTISLEALAQFIQAKGNSLDIGTGLRLTELHRGVSQIEKILEPRAELSRFGNIALEDVSGVCLDQSDSISEVTQVVRQLGYDLSDEDNLRVYEAFQRVAAKKQFVVTKELDAIIATAAMQVPSTYKLVNYVTNSGSIITATANILIEKDGQQIRGVGIGDGPIDAAFQAIEQIIGHHYELDDFQIQTVTEGRDAMGSALVKLRSGGRVYSGNGISTDIIGAAIRAYVSALNKIFYEEA